MRHVRIGLFTLLVCLGCDKEESSSGELLQPFGPGTASDGGEIMGAAGQSGSIGMDPSNGGRAQAGSPGIAGEMGAAGADGAGGFPMLPGAGGDAGAQEGGAMGQAGSPGQGGTGGDRPQAMTNLGSPCIEDQDCAGGTCIDQWPGGYCSRQCESSDDCMAGSCWNLGENSLCLLDCTMQNDCRVAEGYTCDGDNTCYPGQAGPVDPPEMGDGPVGSACSLDSDCDGR